MHVKIGYWFLFVLSLLGCQNEKLVSIKLNVLQYNIWQEGTVIEKGFEAVVDEIIAAEADLIALSEVRNYNNTNLAERLVKALKEKGHVFYAQKSQDTGILSKYPIISQVDLVPVKDDHGSITKAIVVVDGVKIAFYSGHLDYLNCALYLPRAYDGSTWKKLEAPITDINEIESVNLKSKRDEAIAVFLKDASLEIKKGNIVLYGGDNNEPSHLDWIEENKNKYDHNGVVMKWNTTVSIEKSGFKDAYREKFPNPITHPGFTYPADNGAVPIEKLAWSPEADDRDRIDFVFYYPDERLELVNAKIIGPKGDVVRNERILEQTNDIIVAPKGIWPTDHKAVLVNFILKKRRIKF